MSDHPDRRVAAIDLGGTRVKAGLVRDGVIQTRDTTFLTLEGKTQDGTIDRLEAVVRGLCAGAGLGPADLAAVSIGAAGAVRFDEGVVVHSPNFPAWSHFPLRDLLADRLDCPVFLDNDANAVTMGEALYGAGAGHRDFALLTLGSGIGGGLFLDGRLYRGAQGMAGEIGHATVEPNGFPCQCGNRGCLEQYASANGLRNRVREDRLFGGLTDVAAADPDLPRQLYEAAMTGDPRCTEYFERFGRYLAIGIGALLQVLDVPLVVLAGGLARAWPAFLPTLLDELPTRGYRCINEAARVVPCALWEDGGILGAAALFDEASREAPAG